jgi:prophage regulatory protein
MTRKLIRYEDLALKGISYSKNYLWRLEKAGLFPKRVPTGAGRFAYVEPEIDAFTEAKIDARDAGATCVAKGAALSQRKVAEEKKIAERDAARPAETA